MREEARRPRWKSDDDFDAAHHIVGFVLGDVEAVKIHTVEFFVGLESPIRNGDDASIEPTSHPFTFSMSAKSPMQCAGINRHEAGNERVLRERSSEPLGPEFCAAHREVFSEA
jgi:hypothetical protein